MRTTHFSHILQTRPEVDWFEIISENFMVGGGRPLEVLDRILEQYRVVQHGVSMYFGSTDRLKDNADARIVLGETFSSLAIQGTKLYP